MTTISSQGLYSDASCIYQLYAPLFPYQAKVGQGGIRLIKTSIAPNNIPVIHLPLRRWEVWFSYAVY